MPRPRFYTLQSKNKLPGNGYLKIFSYAHTWYQKELTQPNGSNFESFFAVVQTSLAHKISSDSERINMIGMNS